MYKNFKKLLDKIEKKIDISIVHRKQSWSQQGEDVLIDFYFKWEVGKSNPSYLDIGANHPYYLSNTFLFYKNGSNGVTVEPNRLLFNELVRARENDIHLNCGIGSDSGDFDFYILEPDTLSTFSDEFASEVLNSGYAKLKDKVKIKIENINTILEKYFLDNDNYFISIDVEGMDHEIITGIDFSRHKPSLICIELPFAKRQDVALYLNNYDYNVYASNSTNVIFTRNGNQ